MKSWTPAEVRLILDNIDASTKDIYIAYCDYFGSERTYDSVQKKVRLIRSAHSPGPEVEETETGDLSDTVAELLESSAPDLIIPGATPAQKRENIAKAQDWLKDLIEFGKSNPLTIEPKPKVEAGTSLCLLISDIHVGKHTKQFNLAESRRRLTSIPERLSARENPEDIDEVVVMLAGDLVEGEDIYPTQSSHIECSVLEQVQSCVESLWSMIQGLRYVFKCRISVKSVPGNHGRISKTANQKSNWDNVIYYTLQTLINTQSDKEIVFEANYEEFLTFEVQDKIGMIYHHGVKHTGTPAMREKVAGWSVISKFDFMCHGHWHEWHVGSWLGKPVVANGCVCGPDDLSARIAKEDSAKQAYFTVRAGEPLYGFSWLEW